MRLDEWPMSGHCITEGMGTNSNYSVHCRENIYPRALDRSGKVNTHLLFNICPNCLNCNSGAHLPAICDILLQIEFSKSET